MLRLVALGVGIALLGAACAQSGDVPAASKKPAHRPRVKTTAVRTAKIPHWVTAGFELADQELANRTPLTKPNLTDNSKTDGDQLPSKPDFLALMANAGVDAKSAACIYDNISSGPVSKHAALLIDSLTAVPLAGRAQASTSAVGTLNQGDLQQFAVALAPCLNTQTLIALLAGLGGKSVNASSAAANAAALANLTPPQLSGILLALGSQEPNTANLTRAAAAAGVTLTPSQLAALSAVALGSGAGAAIAALGPGNVDVSKVDPSKLGAAGAASLLFAVAAGLTGVQREQLTRLANVNLSKVDINVDPNTLTREQTGSLLLVLLPFFSAASAPNTGGPPPGADPSQIYIPPGTDLSNINPLNFVNRENIIAGLAPQGINPSTAGCLYDRLRNLDPRVLGLTFTSGDFQGSSQVLLAIVGCAIVSN